MCHGAPVVDESQVCAVAYQGRVACFDRATATVIWSTDTSSDSGLAMDDQNVYVTDDKGAVTAYDKTAAAPYGGRTSWQAANVSAPLALGQCVVVGDDEGYVHVLSVEDGSFVARTKADGGASAMRRSTSAPASRCRPSRAGHCVQTQLNNRND